MRVVAGTYGGRKLLVPKTRDIRPTSDKVRGAIFNALGSLMDVKDAIVLDAFCGTGALGLEALSRGANMCLFIDKVKASLDLARANAEALEASENCTFQLSDASKVQLNQSYAFDLIFLDPPYGKGLIEHTLQTLSAKGAVADAAVCVLESEKDFKLPVVAGFEVLKQKTYGDTLVMYLRYSKSVP